ncbi:MAG: hypothetical protein WC374_00210 [Phycisphaerae bacterium]|jgi:hypothetical protein
MSNNICSETKKPNAWLGEFARKTTSQHGEEGIIEKVLEVIGENDKWCVEFGSWDGKTCSNTYSLITDKGYSAVLIEGSKERFGDLVANFKGSKSVICVNEYVGFESTDNLDVILSKTDIPKNFDLLSIDIDGNDYHVWEAVKQYGPKVVIIEFNPTIPSNVEFVQPRDANITQGSSILSITKMAKTKGYELVSATKNNAIYVDAKYFELFGIEDNSIEQIRTDESVITHLFCGYDGTIFIRGFGKLPWHGIRIKESKMQVLPGWAIKRAGDRNTFRKQLGRFYRRLLKEK